MNITIFIRKRGSAKSPLRQGVAAVECAIVAPLLTLLVLGAIDVGQYANVYQKVSDASREGARRAARIETLSTSQVETAVVNYLQQVFPKVPPSKLASAAMVTVNDAAGNPISGGDLTTVTSGSPVGVTVTIRFDVIRWISHLQFLNGRDVTISTTMRRE
jgi:Flp pilus assembly protein TadG